jgi:uncharacterized protein YegL
MSANNSKQWSRATPGLIIFLVDQSGSMDEAYYKSGKNKAEFTALVINRTINELINTNMDGDKVKDRVFISIVGYGGKGGNSVDDLRSDYLSVYADNPIRLEKIKRKVSDGAGGLVDFEEDLPIFLEPLAMGYTPMGRAFEYAKQLIGDWLGKKPDNPAPIIINVSDGLPFNGVDNQEAALALSVASEIMAIQTTDGPPLIFNAHAGAEGGKEQGFEEDESELTDPQARFLFSISSAIPDAYKASAQKFDLNVRPKSKGFVSNARPDTLVKFINFGSSGADKNA